MNNLKFFRNKQNKKFVVSNNNNQVVCDNCGDICNEFIILKQYFHKGSCKRFVCCSGICSKKSVFIGSPEIGTYLITDFIEDDFIFIQPEKIDFQFSNKIDCFSAAKLDCSTNDKTVYSNRGALIDSSVNIKELDLKDENLSTDEGLALLDELANPKNLIRQNKKKLLK